MTDDPFADNAPRQEVNRDRWGRPLITPPGGGKPVAYTRATTVAKAVEDQSNLMKWKQRQTLLGIIARPDLTLAASAASNVDDEKARKRQLNEIAEQCMEASQSSASATKGTALHSLAETHDRGGELRNVPADFAADLAAYVEQTRTLRHRHIEQMMVNDELQIAGTPDRLSTYMSRLYVADIKSGSIGFPHSIAAQLAIYANSVLYDLATGERTPVPGLDKDRAIVIHLPAGTGTCSLHWTDIKAGWDAVRLAVDVRQWRAKKGLLEPIPAVGPDLFAQIDAAQSVEELNVIWLTNSDYWSHELTQRAAARKRALDSAAA